MTVLDRITAETSRPRAVPTLETERLTLRAPRREDAKAIATLANDLRIAENLLRIPHPYGLADAERFIAGANATDLLLAGARVSNPASRRVLQKCGFQWASVGLYRIRAIASSAPVDRFRLDRSLWASLRSWGKVSRVT
jgi:RimJ/RimL family protein N-acetyltransferase